MFGGQRMFYYWNRFLQKNSNFLFSDIRKTPPISTDPDSNTVVYTLLNQPNVNAYLLAAKSLLQYTGTDRKLALVVQSDGTLTESCIQRISQHLPGVIIYDRKSALDLIAENVGKCVELRKVLPELEHAHSLVPIYFKLLNVILRFPGRFVIQIDSDILFIRKPEFILNWIASQKDNGFYCDGGSTVAPDFSEMNFECSNVSLSRFNSGVFGFRNNFSLEMLVPIFQKLSLYRENIFLKWDVEQGVWAVLMNGLPSATCLDDVRSGYVGNGWRSYQELKNTSTVVHFVGSTRFKRLTYNRLAKEVIRELNSTNHNDVTPSLSRSSVECLK